MTEQLDPTNRRDQPAAAEPVLTEKSMSDTISMSEFKRVQQQAFRRKQEIANLTQERDKYKTMIETLQSERDEAVQTVEQITEQYKQFTSQDTLYQRIQELTGELKARDAIEAFSALPDGLDYHEGVRLQDILDAAGVSLDQIEEFSPEVVKEIVGRAQAAKPFMFLQTQAVPDGPGEVRPMDGPAPPAQQQAPQLRAFGGQAIGGGSAIPAPRANPAQTVDWSDPAAVQAYASERDARRN